MDNPVYTQATFGKDNMSSLISEFRANKNSSNAATPKSFNNVGSSEDSFGKDRSPPLLLQTKNVGPRYTQDPLSPTIEENERLEGSVRRLSSGLSSKAKDKIIEDLETNDNLTKPTRSYEKKPSTNSMSSGAEGKPPLNHQRTTAGTSLSRLEFDFGESSNVGSGNRDASFSHAEW